MASKEVISATRSGIWELDEARTRLREAGKERPIAFEPIYARLAGSVAAGLILAQVIYWSGYGKNGKRRAKVFKDGHFWIAKSYAEWAAETGVSEGQAQSGIKKLVELGILVETNKRFKGMHMKHVRLDEAGVCRRLRVVEGVKGNGAGAAFVNDSRSSVQDAKPENLEEAKTVASEAQESTDSELPFSVASITESTQRRRDREDTKATSGLASGSEGSGGHKLPDSRTVNKCLGALAQDFGLGRFSDATEGDYEEIQLAQAWMTGVIERDEFPQVKRDFEAAGSRGLDFRTALAEVAGLELS